MNILSALLLVAGLFFFFAGTIGFLRFPDFYTRMHATGKGDTLGLFLCITGLVVYSLSQGFTWPAVVLSVKLLSIAFFWFLASPTATHAITQSAFIAGVRPWTRDGKVIVEKADPEGNP